MRLTLRWAGLALAPLLPRLRPSAAARRPGRVVRLEGIIFQSDARSTIGAWFIRPFEELDRRVAGIARNRPDAPQPPIHAGIRVAIEVDGREQQYVAEQLVGPLYEDLHDGLHWTPLAEFRARNRGGWSVTVPATAFRGVTDAVVAETVARLNRIEGHRFLGEDCVAFVERAFGGRRLFADSPTLRALGLHVRVADPALPMLRRDAPLDPRAARLLRVETLQHLPDPEGASAPTSASWRVHVAALALLAVVGAIGLGRRLARRR
ncbi:MAG TPA: hypothetical protein VK066_01835 [Chloroflexota bacterium]|nr:hypothetical protein [Chloroflexota bacterium]